MQLSLEAIDMPVDEVSSHQSCEDVHEVVLAQHQA